MATVTAERTHRYNARQYVYQARTHSYSNQYLAAWNAHRYKVTNTVGAERIHRYMAGPQKVTSVSHMGTTIALDTAMGEYEVAWQQGLGTLEVDLRVYNAGSTKDLTGVPTILQVTLNESAPATWQLSILDDTGAYHPKKAGGEWEGWMDDRAYTAGVLTKKLLATIGWGGYTWRFVGVPKRYGHTRGLEQKINFTWAGADVSERLFRKSQTKATLRSDPQSTTPVTNRDAIADTLDGYSLQHDLSRVTKQPIRVQHRQDGRPGDWSMAVFECTWAEWRVRGETVEGFQPDVLGSTVHWKYSADTVTLEENLEAESTDHVNTVTIRRAAESAAPPPSAGGDDDDNTIKLFDFGPQSETFNPPLNGVMWREPVRTNGINSDFIFRNKDGVVIAVREVRGGVWPDQVTNGGPIHGAASVDWTYGAANGFIGTGSYGEIEFFGTSGDNPAWTTTGAQHDDVYTVTVVDSDSVAVDGELPLELTPNPLLVDSVQATNYGKGFLYRKGREREPITIRVALNLAAGIGDGVEIEDAILGTTEVRYVKQLTHSISNDDAQRFTRMLLVKYPVINFA